MFPLGPMSFTPSAAGIPAAGLDLVRRAALAVTLVVAKDDADARPVSYYKDQHVTLNLRQLVDEEDGVVIASKRVTVLASQMHAKRKSDAFETVVLDAADAAQQWLLEPEDNLGLKVECAGCEEAGLDLLGPDEDNEPTLEVDVETKRRPSNTRRQKRSFFSKSIAPKSDIGVKRRKNLDCKAVNDNNKKRRNNGKGNKKRKNKQRKQRCCRERMEVDFTKLHGFDFILEPATFEAYLCAGRCPGRYNPANGHALLQSILHAQSRGGAKKDHVPRPCCAPSRLSSRPILHVAQDGSRLEVSQWKNVVVEECRCS